MQDPCAHLREKAAAALQELTSASAAMAEFSVSAPYESNQEVGDRADYLQRMSEAFERERVAWEQYYSINLELLECVRTAYRPQSESGSVDRRED